MLIPLTTNHQALFTLAILSLCALALASTQTIFSNGPLASGLLVFICGWGMMNFIAWMFEERTMLNPSHNFKQYYFGDLGLVVVAVLAATKLDELGGQHAWSGWLWTTVCLIAATGIALAFRYSELNSVYTFDQLNSPTKVVHDLLTVPALLYMLFWSAPAFFTGDWVNLRTGVAVILALAWLVLGIYDGSRSKPSPGQAHPAYHWR